MAGDDDLPLRYRYSWPRPAVTVDCLIYTLEANEPMILLIKRKNDPCKGCWALPGGFVEENEGLEDAASRELEEETGISDSSMVQTGAYGDFGRDPRGHTVTVAFMAWAPSIASCKVQAGDDAAEACFYPVHRLPRLAFDHLKIIRDSWRRCEFRATVASGEAGVGVGTDKDVEGVGDQGMLSVLDRASGQKLEGFVGVPELRDVLVGLEPCEVEVDT